VVLLDESGSSANVALVLGHDGKPEVHKTCSHEGIDGNGSPWLRKQAMFFSSSIAVKETGMFVEPLTHVVAGDAVSLTFPYVPGHSLA
jgi:hypothetical protein